MLVRLRSACALAIVLALAGCNSTDDWSRPRAAPTPVGALGPGFVDPAAPPSPEATITPSPGSWDGVRPSKGYRVVLLTADETRVVLVVLLAVDRVAALRRAAEPRGARRLVRLVFGR